MYDYSSYGIEQKLRPHTKRKIALKIVSSVLKLILLVIINVRQDRLNNKKTE